MKYLTINNKLNRIRLADLIASRQRSFSLMIPGSIEIDNLRDARVYFKGL